MSVALPGAVGTAVANPQVGSCTKSYTLYDKAGLSFDPAAVAIFDVIDTNHNGLICFKPYPNGDHAGHAGNLVDDKAGPH
ncbi:MAG TPA: hypothetical protein VFJ17_07985 [Mycobacteriales bacterium]|jgi:hypothetical protein|nr:hypothetical protein [Mycobacteriales bacterium]